MCGSKLTCKAPSHDTRPLPNHNFEKVFSLKNAVLLALFLMSANKSKNTGILEFIKPVMICLSVIIVNYFNI